MSELIDAPIASATVDRRLKRAGFIVLAVGVASAALVYWLGTHSAAVSDDPEMLGYDRAQQRQVGVLFGQSGQMVDDFISDLKKPSWQAGIIITVSVLIALGCFHLARPLEAEEESSGPPGDK